jgi:hypothetical protein
MTALVRRLAAAWAAVNVLAMTFGWVFEEGAKRW